MLKNTELRKLPADTLCKIVNSLEINDDWKRVMTIIPKNLHIESSEPKYNYEHIRLIEEHAKLANRKCSEILLDEWGTSGRVRPTLNNLKDILIKADIYRAADEIAIILGDPLPQRPSYGPAACISTNVTEILNNESTEQRLNNMSAPTKSHFNQIGNGTTRQMKSESDMIQFSKTFIPGNTINESICNKTTAQMKSESDLIKFSKSQQVTQESQESLNMPDLSAMLGKTQKFSESTISPTASQSTNSDTSKLNQDDTINYPNNYQTSFPNIDISLGIDTAILHDTNLTHFEYTELEKLTGKFSDNPENGPNGLMGRIGRGGFGDVFVGNHPKFGMLAVKKAHSHILMYHKPDIAMKVFNAEVKFLSQFRHKNIVPIIGFSKDGPVPCIVCEYIDGGSLQENIVAKKLNEVQRMNIILGTAEGLKYLHTSEKSLQNPEIGNVSQAVGESDSQNSAKNFVHGDVKTANILLTKECVPKLCDFGLAKQYDSTIITTSPMGTSPYMPHEAHRGTITQKLDIYSFGIVLLELLTGLKAIVINNGDKLHINDYVIDNIVNNDVSPILDPVVSTWSKANDIYLLAKNCLEHQRQNRPTIEKVCDILYKINSN